MYWKLYGIANEERERREILVLRNKELEETIANKQQERQNKFYEEKLEEMKATIKMMELRISAQDDIIDILYRVTYHGNEKTLQEILQAQRLRRE